MNIYTDKMILDFEDECPDFKPFIMLKDRNPDNKYLLSDYVLKYVEMRGSFFLMISGNIGSGKSIASISLAEDIDSKFNIDRIIFNIDDLENTLQQKHPKGSVFLFEDINISNYSKQQYMEIYERFLSALERFKNNNWILILTITNPNIMEKDVRTQINGFAEMIRGDDGSMGWLRYFNVYYDKKQNVLIHRFIRLIYEDGRTQIIKGRDHDSANMKFELPSEVIVKEYKKKLVEMKK